MLLITVSAGVMSPGLVNLSGVFSALGAKLSCRIYLEPPCALLLFNNSTQLPLSPPRPHPRAPLTPQPFFISLLICRRVRQIINLAGLFILRLIFSYLYLRGGREDDAIQMSSSGERTHLMKERVLWQGGITNEPVTFSADEKKEDVLIWDVWLCPFRCETITCTLTHVRTVLLTARSCPGALHLRGMSALALNFTQNPSPHLHFSLLTEG